MISQREFLCFGLESKALIEKYGLSWPAVEEIFLCRRYSGPPENLLSGCPIGSAKYQARERKASGQSLLAIRDRSFDLPNPWTGELLPSKLTSTFDDPACLKNYFFVPLIYGYAQDQTSFWAISCDLTGRIIHLFFPALNLVVYELNLERAKKLDLNLTENLDTLQNRLAAYNALQTPKLIGILDMVNNFGHQMINHLSGIELLIKSGLDSLVDEYWVCGPRFFGPVEALFTELNGKARYFERKIELADEILKEPILAVRIGSNCFYKETRARILRSATLKYSYPRILDRYPLIAVSVRTGGRVCTNLDEIVTRIYEKLLPTYPSLGFIIDGWVFAESDIVDHSSVATSLDQRFALRIKEELTAARSAFRAVPSSAIVRNLIGTSIVDSVVGLLDIDSYIAHVGTLQHKIAFFSLVQGLVHGPKEQLITIDSGAYQAELGHAPVYLEASMVDDIATKTERGASFYDYRVNDVESFVSSLLKVI